MNLILKKLCVTLGFFLCMFASWSFCRLATLEVHPAMMWWYGIVSICSAGGAYWTVFVFFADL